MCLSFTSVLDTPVAISNCDVAISTYMHHIATLPCKLMKLAPITMNKFNLHSDIICLRQICPERMSAIKTGRHGRLSKKHGRLSELACEIGYTFLAVNAQSDTHLIDT